MNRSESKYFATAARMDEAFLKLLERKDLAYITVKEICEAAGVNRSTFYLHYETIGDLLEEAVRHLNEQFLRYMQKDSAAFVGKLQSCPLEELYLVTPEYLLPYLRYIRENKRIFRTAVKNAGVLRLEETYHRLCRHILLPILERFGVPEADRGYLLTFYLHGIMAIVTQWLKNDCEDSLEHVIAVMQHCAAYRREEL